MKLHTMIFLGFFLLQSTLIFPLSNEDMFLKGNQLFAQGNYVQACDAYQAIDNKGFVVFYNLGLSYLNQGKRSQAILSGKRAEKQASFCQLTQLYDFFDCMNRQVNPDYSPGWYEQLAIFMKKCILSISMLLVQLSLLGAIILLMLCWYRRWYQINVKAFMFIIFCYTMLLTVYWYKTDMMQQQVGIVTKNLIGVFAGPDELFYKKCELHESDELIILSQQQGYYQVRAKQMVGWIHNNDIELV